MTGEESEVTESVEEGTTGRAWPTGWEVLYNLLVFRRPLTTPAPGSRAALRRVQAARRATHEAASHERPE